MTATTLDQQHQPVLTAHPLQRIGAYALAELADVDGPDAISVDDFQSALRQMTRHVLYAARHRDTKVPGAFWLKASMSFFPNSPMNHNAQRRKNDEDLTAEVQAWRSLPDPSRWPGTTCVLCARAAVGFYGKVDVPLTESVLYRNNTPPGHKGLALCWACLCSFYALPYGCQLTGGPSIAVHSWDESFLQEVVGRQVGRNWQHITAGVAVDKGTGANREMVALRALRSYEHELASGVDLIVFSNHNNSPLLEIHTLEQPLAEWLRKTINHHPLRDGFRALLCAHAAEKHPGHVGLARNAFRSPEQIPAACVRYLEGQIDRTRSVPRAAASLSRLCRSFAVEVMRVNQKDLSEIEATAHGVALLLGEETSAGKLRELYSMRRAPGRLRTWLQAKAMQWRFPPDTWKHSPPEGYDPARPLMTTRSFTLLFDPDPDSQAWFHRNLLFVSVLERLHELNWQPSDGAKVAAETADEADELGAEDTRFLEGEKQT